MGSFATMEDHRKKKPFLGGWRDKITNKKYLNAVSQTRAGQHRLRTNGAACIRMTQSVETKNANTQLPCTRSTQMWRPDCNVSNEKDRYMTTQPYETYEEMEMRLDLNRRARIIQRNYRVYRLLKYIKKCAKEYRGMVECCKKRQEKKLIAYRKRHQDEIIGKVYPTSRSDFDMLYELIENWRRDRAEPKKLGFLKAGQCVENYMTLDKLTEMLNVIDGKMRALKDRFRRWKRVCFIILNCRPIRWNGYKGKLVEMVTLKNQKARELRSIYETLSNFDASSKQRMELLLSLRKVVEQHNCAAAFELINLVNQEVNLSHKGIKSATLRYLKERILCGYLRFVRASDDCGCEDCNKDLWKNVESEKLREPVESETKVCRSCWKLHPYRRFAIHGRIKKLATCVGCSWMSQRNIGHVNYRTYEYLLNCVRAEERRKKSSSALAFMMQVRDIYHLVNNIWHGRSVISKTDNLYLLRLIRYNVNEEWCPWNCILLTEEESEVHYKINDLSAVYSEHLLHQISLAHQIAKNHFKYLSMLEKNFRASSRYCMIQDRLDNKPSIKMTNHYFY